MAHNIAIFRPDLQGFIEAGCQKKICYGDQVAAFRFFLGDDHFDSSCHQLASHFRKMRTIPSFRLHQTICNNGHISGQLTGPDIVERIELIAGSFDDPKRIENGNLAS